MNKQRRMRLRQAYDMIDEARMIIEEVKKEEEEACENIAEHFPDSKRVSEMEDYISSMDDAANWLEEVGTALAEIY